MSDFYLNDLYIHTPISVLLLRTHMLTHTRTQTQKLQTIHISTHFLLLLLLIPILHNRITFVNRLLIGAGVYKLVHRCILISLQVYI